MRARPMWASLGTTRRLSSLPGLLLPEFWVCWAVPPPWFGFGPIVPNFSGDVILPNCGHVSHAVQPAPLIAAQLGYRTPLSRSANLMLNFADVSSWVYDGCPFEM